MPLVNMHLINIHSIRKPPTLPIPIRSQNHIIPRHHPLPHLPLLIERPILQPITPLPPLGILSILVLVPELYGDAVLRECKQLFAETVRLLFLELRV